jgi:hypothetical protein
MKSRAVLLTIALLTAALATVAPQAAAPAAAQQPSAVRTPVAMADSAAIRATAQDYAEGWYAGDAARMQRALHPDLAKRIVHDAGGSFTLQQMSAAQLIDATRSGGGRNGPGGARQADVAILDIFGNTASVRLTMDGWIDYMHMARWQGRWVIVNVLWELKPR